MTKIDTPVNRSPFAGFERTSGNNSGPGFSASLLAPKAQETKTPGQLEFVKGSPSLLSLTPEGSKIAAMLMPPSAKGDNSSKISTIASRLVETSSLKNIKDAPELNDALKTEGYTIGAAAVLYAGEDTVVSV